MYTERAGTRVGENEGVRTVPSRGLGNPGIFSRHNRYRWGIQKRVDLNPHRTERKLDGESFRQDSQTVRRDGRPYSVDDIEKEEPLIETVAEELGRGAAYSLSPETEAGFTESVKQAVLSSTADRQAELRAMDRALEREETSVRSAAEVADDILNARSMEETTEVEIISSGFDELKQMYDEVSGFIDRCGEEIQSRQKTLRATTSNGASAGVRHHKIVAYVYQELPTEYPVMSTITRLNQLCEERKRVLRNQLARTS